MVSLVYRMGVEWGIGIKQSVEFIWKIKIIYVKEIFFSQNENVNQSKKFLIHQL